MSYVFESGEEVITGDAGEHDYTFVSGTPLTDRGGSTLVFESGTGIGGAGEVTLIKNGTAVGSVEYIVDTSRTASEFYNYAGDVQSNSAGNPWYQYLTTDSLTVAVVNATDGCHYFHTYTSPDGGTGTADVNLSGTEGSVVVEDDPPGAYDNYSLTFCQNGWDPGASDGFVIGDFSGGSKTVELDFSTWSNTITQIRLVGPNNTVSTSIDGTETWQVKFTV